MTDRSTHLSEIGAWGTATVHAGLRRSVQETGWSLHLLEPTPRRISPGNAAHFGAAHLEPRPGPTTNVFAVRRGPIPIFTASVVESSLADIAPVAANPRGIDTLHAIGDQIDQAALDAPDLLVPHLVFVVGVERYGHGFGFPDWYADLRAADVQAFLSNRDDATGATWRARPSMISAIVTLRTIRTHQLFDVLRNPRATNPLAASAFTWGRNQVATEGHDALAIAGSSLA